MSSRHPLLTARAGLAAAMLFAGSVAAGATGLTSEPMGLRHGSIGEQRVTARVFDGHHDLGPCEVVVSGGRIVSVRPVHHLHDDEVTGWLSPGLIDLDAEIGQAWLAAEPVDSITADLRAIDAFAPEESELAAWRASGVTSCWLSAGRWSVLAGQGAWVQPSDDGHSVLSAAAGHVGNLIADARDPERAPTSLPGQSQLLAERLGSLRSGAPPRVRFDDTASLRQARRLHGVLPMGSPGATAELIEYQGLRSLVVTDLGPGSGTDALAATARLLADANGPRFGFGSSWLTGGPRQLRSLAARLVQDGLSRERALAGLTSDAAALAGLSDRGSIRAGAVADLVLWSGDPLLPASRARKVWVGGRLVHDEDEVTR
ncbi:MAG: amidohydrolase family protein [Acidobacteriota bacterium]